MFKLYKNSDMIKYFLISIHLCTQQMKISSYLIKYISNKMNETILDKLSELDSESSESYYYLQSINVYVKNLIKLKPIGENNVC